MLTLGILYGTAFVLLVFFLIAWNRRIIFGHPWYEAIRESIDWFLYGLLRRIRKIVMRNSRRVKSVIRRLWGVSSELFFWSINAIYKGIQYVFGVVRKVGNVVGRHVVHPKIGSIENSVKK